MSVSPLLEGDTITYDFQKSCYTKYILPLNNSFVVFKHLYCNERGNIVVNNQRKKKARNADVTFWLYRNVFSSVATFNRWNLLKKRTENINLRSSRGSNSRREAKRGVFDIAQQSLFL